MSPLIFSGITLQLVVSAYVALLTSIVLSTGGTSIATVLLLAIYAGIVCCLATVALVRRQSSSIPVKLWSIAAMSTAAWWVLLHASGRLQQ